MAVSNCDKLGQVLVISLGIGVVQLDVVHLKRFTVVIGSAVDVGRQKELLGWEHKLGIADRFSVLINHTERNLFFLLCYALCWCFLVDVYKRQGISYELRSIHHLFCFFHPDVFFLCFVD